MRESNTGKDTRGTSKPCEKPKKQGAGPRQTERQGGGRGPEHLGESVGEGAGGPSTRRIAVGGGWGQTGAGSSQPLVEWVTVFTEALRPSPAGNAGAEKTGSSGSCTEGAESRREGSGPGQEASTGGKGERVVACGLLGQGGRGEAGIPGGGPMGQQRGCAGHWRGRRGKADRFPQLGAVGDAGYEEKGRK